MAMQITPPTKNIFHLSVFLAMIGVILYFLGVFDVFEGGFQAVGHYAFWASLLGWLVLLIGVSAKGV